MDKKQFYSSLLSDRSTEKWDILDLFGVSQSFFDTLEEMIPSKTKKERFRTLSNEVLLRAWMFDRVFNEDGWKNVGSKMEIDQLLSPLMIIYLFGEPFFTNAAYCIASWLSVSEVKIHARSNDLYDYMYTHDDAERAKKQVLKLKAGKGYRNFSSSLKHSHKKILWNSFWGAGEQLEVRIGRDITYMEDVKNEGGEHFSGNTMCSPEILHEIYDILSEWESSFSIEDEDRLTWLSECFSLFDFIWNHGGFLTECVLLPKTSLHTVHPWEIFGIYNSVYAWFFEKKHRDTEDFSQIFSIVHHENDTKLALAHILAHEYSSQEEIFYQKNGKPVMEILWNRFSCSCPRFADQAIFSVWLPIRCVQKEGVFHGFWKRFLPRPVEQSTPAIQK